MGMICCYVEYDLESMNLSVGWLNICMRLVCMINICWLVRYGYGMG